MHNAKGPAQRGPCLCVLRRQLDMSTVVVAAASPAPSCAGTAAVGDVVEEAGGAASGTAFFPAAGLVRGRPFGRLEGSSAPVAFNSSVVHPAASAAAKAWPYGSSSSASFRWSSWRSTRISISGLNAASRAAWISCIRCMISCALAMPRSYWPSLRSGRAGHLITAGLEVFDGQPCPPQPDLAKAPRRALRFAEWSWTETGPIVQVHSANLTVATAALTAGSYVSAAVRKVPADVATPLATLTWNSQGSLTQDKPCATCALPMSVAVSRHVRCCIQVGR